MVKINSEINPNIFRAYDIRGKYPEEINEKSVYLIGRAFVRFLSKKSRKKVLRIVIGRDNRLSSLSLFRALVKGIIQEGAKVIDIGLSTSPMLYFGVAHYGFDGGINITASHNSAEYNGLKIVREKAIPISEKTGLQEIQKLCLRSGLKHLRNPRTDLGVAGKIIKKDVLKDYLRFNFKSVKKSSLKDFKKLKIVVDTANAVSGIVVSKFFDKLPCKIFYLFKKSDGSFPNHPPNPLKKENLRAIQKEVRNRKADLGVAFDGDGDRIVFLDHLGRVISGDLITAFLAEIILEKQPCQKILYDLRSSNVVEETIRAEKGIPIKYKIGHSFIKAKMREENIIFGGELSGHYYVKQHYFCEAPFFVLLKILERMSEQKKTLSALISPYKKYFYSGEINFKIENKKRALKTLEQKYKKGRIFKLDGLRIDFKDWWFLVRPSNTEPVVRLIVEAKIKGLMEKKRKEIAKVIIRI
jgi:phosphomannomutase